MLSRSRGIEDAKLLVTIHKAHVGEAELWISSILEEGGDPLRRDDHAQHPPRL